MKRNIHIALLFFIAAIFFTGCAKSVQEEETANGEYVYVDSTVNVYSAVNYSAQLEEQQYVYLFDAAEQAIYYVVLNVLDGTDADFENRIYRLDYDKLAQSDDKLKKEYGWTNESDTDILSLSEDITPQVLINKFIGNIYSYAGKLYVLNKEYNAGTDRTDYLVYCIDEKGETELICDISEGYRQAAEMAGEALKNCSSSYDSFSVHEMENGLVFLVGFRSTSGTIEHITYAIDSDNNVTKLADEELSEDCFEQRADGVYKLEGNELVRYDDLGHPANLQTKKLGSFGADTFLGIVKNSADTEGKLKVCLYNSEGIYRLTEDKYCQELKWSDMGLKKNKWKSMVAYGDEHFFAVSCNNGKLEIVDMTRSDIAAGEREELVIGTLYQDEQLSRLVRLFNAAQGRYEAKIRIYDNEDSLNTELIAGKGPDVFPADAVDIRTYAANGIIENLAKYIDSESSILTRDMLFENIVDVFTIDAVLVTIPDRFYIKAYVGLKDRLGEDGGWTMDEVVKSLTDEPELTIYDFALGTDDTRYHIADILMKGMEESFVDMENGRAYFETDEFMKLLEFVETYQSPIIDNTLTRNELIDDGKVLAEAVQLLDMDSIADWTEDGRYVMKGYPNAGGDAAYGIYVSNSFCINADSGHKEAAWNYIQYIVTSLAYDDVASGLITGFPTVISQYEKLLDISAKAHDKNYVIPQSAKEQFYYMLNNIQYIAGWDNDVVMQIVDEELMNMLLNNLSAQDTVSVIQNRVQLYLDERK